jgi:hypothetical protein
VRHSITFGRANHLANRCLTYAPYVSLCGVAGLAVNLILSFEEPHPGLLTACAILLLAAPLAMVTHFIVTPELTPTEKRLWVRALRGRRSVRVIAAYFSPAERARVTRELTDSTF